MKNSFYALASVCLALSPCVVRAQSSDTTAAPAATAPVTAATPSVSTPPAAKGKGARQGRMANLTPEEQTKLRAARQAAMKDPEVVAAQAKRTEDPKAFRLVMEKAMLHADPSVAAILEKQKAGRKANKGKGALGQE